jgi:hypothetical protein
VVIAGGAAEDAAVSAPRISRRLARERYHHLVVWYLYLDESGDLGFDFFAKHPSNYFTVSVLVVRDGEANSAMLRAAKVTRRRKLPLGHELKGAKTAIEVKRYFYNRVKEIPFEVYALTLNKRRVYDQLTQVKDRVYNFIARLVLDRIPMEQADTRVVFVIDRSKNRDEVADFNAYVTRNLTARLDPRVPLNIYHVLSSENGGLQAADLFSWGIFRVHERNDTEWRDVYRAKIAFDGRYL